MSDIQFTILIFSASGALSFLSAPLFSLSLMPIAGRIGAVDVPRDARRMHKTPIARIGGVAILLSFLLGGAILSIFGRSAFTDSSAKLLLSLSAGGTVITLGGLADDIFTLSPWQKITYQTLAALVAAGYGARLTDGAAGVIGFILWSVFLSNALNLIDGLDGLSGGVSAATMIGLLSMSDGEPVIMILLCAILGFLPLNLRPARLFLGDSGAMLLGFSLSVISSEVFYLQSRMDSAVAIALALALPVLDTAFAVVRRIKRGRSPFSPDREHIHHRLVDAGLSHGQASFLLIMLAGGFSALGATLFFTGFSLVSLILSSLLIFPTAFVIMIAEIDRMKNKF